MAKKKVEPITYDKEGNMIINLSATEGGDDWLRAGRLLEQGRIEEYNEMMNAPMYILDDDVEDDDPNS